MWRWILQTKYPPKHCWVAVREQAFNYISVTPIAFNASKLMDFGRITAGEIGHDSKLYVYITSSLLFHGEIKSSSGTSINGKVSKVTGANLDLVTDDVAVLPISDLDHGTLYSIYCVMVQLSLWLN
jgi:hypothetical protein